KGKGVPHLNSHGKGDLVVEVRIQTPGKLSKQQKDLLKQLGDTMKVENTPHAHGIIDRVKDIFN
ncbi:MAG: molecular chaperone DnaJ, partial [Janthinobacterium lividum]